MHPANMFLISGKSQLSRNYQGQNVAVDLVTSVLDHPTTPWQCGILEECDKFLTGYDFEMVG